MRLVARSRQARNQGAAGMHPLPFTRPPPLIFTTSAAVTPLKCANLVNADGGREEAGEEVGRRARGGRCPVGGAIGGGGDDETPAVGQAPELGQVGVDQGRKGGSGHLRGRVGGATMFDAACDAEMRRIALRKTTYRGEGRDPGCS